jgi:chemotaxis protein MotC
LRWLLKGAAQFAKGETAEALKTLTPFKPEKLPASIGGRVALAMAALLPDGERIEKARLLEVAARQMPGTLVEEAALRRLATLAAAQDDPLQFQKTAERYVWRYSASLYAGGFMKDYVAQIVNFETKHKPVSRLAFEVLMNRLPAAQRCQAYLGVARQATSLGLADLALYASTRARRLAAQGSAEWSEATLYDAAILITGPDYDIALDLLRAVNGSQLDAQGKAMLASAEALAASMHADFDPSLVPDAALKRPSGLRALPAEQQALSDKVSKAVAAADMMLQGLTP